MKNKPMKLSTIWIIILSTFLVLALSRVVWINYHQPEQYPQAVAGVIDFSESELQQNKLFSLIGEWEFYPNEFINPGSFQANEAHKQYRTIPHNWMDDPLNNTIGPIQYGTYRLQLQLPEKTMHHYGFKIDQISTAADIYLDGRVISSYGKPGTSADQAEGKFGPQTILIHPEYNEIELVIHVSNFDLSFRGGMTKPILFASEEKIIAVSQQSKQLQLVVGIVFFLHSLYVFLFTILSKGRLQKPIYYFGLLLLLHAVTILIDDDVVIQLPVSFVTHEKILLSLFISTLFSLLLFIQQLFSVDHRSFRYFTYAYLALIFSIIIVPTGYIIPLGIFITIYFLVAFIFLYRTAIKQLRIGFKDGIFVILFITSYASNFIWGGFINLNVVQLPYYPFDFLISIIFIVLLLFKQHIRTVEINIEQTEQLQRADKMKDEFLANTSHEVRNPLHGIINIAQSILDNETKLSLRSRENLQLLIDIGKRMNVTLNDLTTVSELKEGKITLQKKQVNVHVLSKTVIHMLEFVKQGKDIELRSTIPSSFPSIIADENRLLQILFNLVHNAIKYTEEGHITIDATLKDDACTISVTDTGVGIDDAELEKVFQPYERLNQQLTNYTTGIGIGLSICKQLVELHGGMITFQSLNNGARFEFTIPVDDVALTHSLHENERNLPTTDVSFTDYETTDQLGTPFLTEHRHSILIVDDDPINTKVLEEMLRDDYVTYTALNGKNALAIIEAERLDLVISDIMMPHMSGYELTEQIRSRYTLTELPVLLMTARGLPEDIETAFLSGANDYLVKPVNALELRTRIAALTFLKTSVKQSLQMETALLKAQVQPHFLFNTLNSIAALGATDPDRMVELLEAFGTYLERSFANKNIRDEIPLQNELELTKAYVHIEKERFGERITVLYDIDENLNVCIPPLTIQPLVENAILHGILPKMEGGTVSLSIKQDGTEVNISVTDNGVGIEAGKVERLLRLTNDIHSGIGISNTHRRLVQLYGKGFSIDSTVGEGTTITFSLPLIVASD